MRIADQIMDEIQSDAVAKAERGLRVTHYRLSEADWACLHDDLKKKARYTSGRPAYEARYFTLHTAAGTVRVEPCDDVQDGQLGFVTLLERDANDMIERYMRQKLNDLARDKQANGAFPIDEPRRPPREDYVRVTVECEGFTLEPAVEYRRGEDFTSIATSLRRAADGPWSACTDQMLIADLVAYRIAERWPDRAYFVEVWQDGCEGFAQIFQPFGVPRNR
jgi:hypothetical protein